MSDSSTVLSNLLLTFLKHVYSCPDDRKETKTGLSPLGRSSTEKDEPKYHNTYIHTGNSVLW